MPAKPNPKGDISTLGKKYGKPDIERLGIFIEASYMNGKKYVSPFSQAASFKGKNMMTSGRKIKDGTQIGYFDDTFRRLFEGEAINWRKPKQKKPPKGAIKAIFMPSGPSKWHATPGDYFGCFSGIIEHFSNERKKKPKYERPKPNFTTSPVKEGGPGYVDICLSKYPEHKPDPYKPKPKRERPKKGEKRIAGGPMITVIYPKPYFDNNPFIDPKGKIGPTYVRPKPPKGGVKKGTWIPTGPSKWQGGMHAGCFDPFPEWMAGKKQKPQKKQKASVFYPQSMALKTMFTTAVLPLGVDISITPQNYATYEPRYTKYLLD